MEKDKKKKETLSPFIECSSTLTNPLLEEFIQESSEDEQVKKNKQKKGEQNETY